MINTVVNITLPATREDGSPLPVEEIASFTLYHGTSPVDVSGVVGTFPASTVSVTVNIDETVDNYFVAKVLDTDSQFSALSEVLTVPAVPKAPPSPPVLS